MGHARSGCQATNQQKQPTETLNQSKYPICPILHTSIWLSKCSRNIWLAIMSIHHSMCRLSNSLQLVYLLGKSDYRTNFDDYGRCFTTLGWHHQMWFCCISFTREETILLISRLSLCINCFIHYILRANNNLYRWCNILTGSITTIFTRTMQILTILNPTLITNRFWKLRQDRNYLYLENLSQFWFHIAWPA